MREEVLWGYGDGVMFGDFMAETCRRILGKASILWPDSSPQKNIEVGRILPKSVFVEFM